MGTLSQEEINVDLFDEVKRLKAENKEYQGTLIKIKEAYESKDENKLDELLYSLFTNEIYDDSY